MNNWTRFAFLFNRFASRTAFWLAVTFMVGVSATAMASNPWFTGRTVGGQTKPIGLTTSLIQNQPETSPASGSATFDSGLVDVVISLYNNPTGDDNGNTQANPPSQQDVIERIVQFWADGIYEATQGAHRLRKVRIYRNGHNADKADVVWVASVWPSSPASGVNLGGGHINFGDVFPGGCGPGCDYNMLNDPTGAGYTLAHEWGHYAYGLFDEYKIETTDVAVVPSIMNSQWNATGGDYRWLNYSIINSGGGAFQDTLHTYQHCNYQASCWEVLARATTADPFQYPTSSGCTYSLAAPRIFYPELAAVAPAGNATPQIDLPNPAARANLDIIWETDSLVLQIVIDHSGSMGFEPDKMSNARTAAKLLVDQAGTGNSVIGVIKFDDVVETVYPLTQVTDVNVQNAIKAAIDTITPRNNTAVYNAAQEALSQLQSLPSANDTKATFLLTDGLDNSSTISAATVVTNYQNAQVPIFTFGYGSDADVNALQYLANQTGGLFFSSPTTLADISAAFDTAFVNASSYVGVDSGTQAATSVPQNVPFVVDASMSKLNLTLVFAGTPNTVNVQLVDPIGNRATPQSVELSGGDTIEFFTIDGPVPGVWTLSTSTTGSPVDVHYRIVGVPGGPTLVAGLTSVNGDSIVGPAPLILQAHLDRGLGVVGAGVSGSAHQPDGSEVAVQFADDGVAPDTFAGDGIYTARFVYTQNGLYNFTVRFNNDSGMASFGYTGLNLTPRVDGTAPDVPPVAGSVGFNFNRSASAQVSVSNAPTIVCPSDIVVPSASSRCGTVVNYTVATALGLSAACVPPSGSVFPAGLTRVSCTASGTPDSCSFNVTVEDRTPPTMTDVSASPASLWPPNHKMRDVTIGYSAADLCSPVSCELAVTSNEPENGTGDGDTAPDWIVLDNHHIQLRAERAGTGNGRTYTTTARCTDASSNSVAKPVTVTVPHNR